MSAIVEEIRQEVKKRCIQYKESYNYDFWKEHFQFVVNYAVELANQQGADVEIVELAALLHDISLPSQYGTREDHHLRGAEIAEELLTQKHYPKDRIEKVKNCVLHHRGSVLETKNTIEEECVADADVMAHFNNIPLLFECAYGKVHQFSVSEGAQWVKKKLERDFQKLSPKSKQILKERYQKIQEVLFCLEEEEVC